MSVRPPSAVRVALDASTTIGRCRMYTNRRPLNCEAGIKNAPGRAWAGCTVRVSSTVRPLRWKSKCPINGGTVDFRFPDANTESPRTAFIRSSADLNDA